MGTYSWTYSTTTENHWVPVTDCSGWNYVWSSKPIEVGPPKDDVTMDDMDDVLAEVS